VRFPANTDVPYFGKIKIVSGILPAALLFARCILPFMKILFIDNDSKRISTLKSLELNGHLVQAVETLSVVREFLDSAVCQILVLGPEQIAGDSLNVFSEWRQSLTVKTTPLVVALGDGNDGIEGVDHFLPITFDAVDLVELPTLRGVPPEPEIAGGPAPRNRGDSPERRSRAHRKTDPGYGRKRLENR
jgi:hypothetical protein